MTISNDEITDKFCATQFGSSLTLIYAYLVWNQKNEGANFSWCWNDVSTSTFPLVTWPLKLFMCFHSAIEHFCLSLTGQCIPFLLARKIATKFISFEFTMGMIRKWKFFSVLFSANQKVIGSFIWTFLRKPIWFLIVTIPYEAVL